MNLKMDQKEVQSTSGGLIFHSENGKMRVAGAYYSMKSDALYQSLFSKLLLSEDPELIGE